MLPIHDECRRHAGAVVHCTVERELSEWYSGEPVQTVLMAKCPYYLLDSLVVSESVKLFWR